MDARDNASFDEIILRELICTLEGFFVTNTKRIVPTELTDQCIILLTDYYTFLLSLVMRTLRYINTISAYLIFSLFSVHLSMTLY